ncbi:hypothetical protein V8E53_015133 [Lactarius tabidus]
MTYFSSNSIRTKLGILRSAGKGESSTGKPAPCSSSQFHAPDRETGTTLVLRAAPSHTGQLHSVASRAVRRDSSLHESTDMVCIRSAFAELASRSSSLLE